MRFIAGILISLSVVFFSNQQLNQIIQSKPINIRLVPPPVENIEHLTFGYNDIMADSIWLRTIQNLETCNIMGELPKNISDSLKPHDEPSSTQNIDPVVAHALQKTQTRRGECSRGWAFQMMDASTRLSPRFEVIYSLGATALSVLMDDFEGAHLLFERGVKNLPHNWSIAYRAAYNSLFDRKDFTRAAELLKQAGENGAPAWVNSLAARLFSQSGQAAIALPLLEDLYQKTDNPNAKLDLAQRIKALRALLHP